MAGVTTCRRWRVGQEAGDIFVEGDDFDGLTLTIELRDITEARRAVALMHVLLPDSPCGDEIDGYETPWQKDQPE